MKSQFLASKLLVLMFAALVVNQMACNNASFEATDDTAFQTAPRPDNPDRDDFFDDRDAGQTIRCDCQGSTASCDPGDIGINPNTPNLSWDLPRTNVTRRGVNCYSNIYYDTRRNPINAVDVWLVVDSSGSFNDDTDIIDEREAVANAIAGDFIQQLAQQVPVRVSVIVGHAPSGPYGGRVSDAPATNPEVFYRTDSEPLTITINGPGDISRARSQLLAKLDDRMRVSPMSLARNNKARIGMYGNGVSNPSRFYNGTVDFGSINGNPGSAGPHSGSDEVGLRNFYDAMRRTRLAANSGWVVLFLSDENDVCTPTTSRSSRSSHPWIRRNSPVPNYFNFYFSHAFDEQNAFEWYCHDFSLQRVYAEAVRYANGQPYAMGAMVYRNRSTIPAGAHPQADVGKGYLDLVAMAQGVTVDLASASSTAGLNRAARNVVQGLAEITNRATGTQTQYGLFTDRSSRRVNLSQVGSENGALDVQVFINGEDERRCYGLDGQNSLIQLTDIAPGEEVREVRIDFCTRD
jgi:hypothetical protein